jgi:hypothetical protein
VKGDLSVAAGRHFGKVVIDRLARIDPQLLRCPIDPEVPSTLVVCGSEQLAVAKFDALAQLKGQLGPLLIPFPAGRQIGYDRFKTALCHMLVEHNDVPLTVVAIGMQSSPQRHAHLESFSSSR